VFPAVCAGTEFAGDSFLEKVKLEIVVSKDQVFLIGQLLYRDDSQIDEHEIVMTGS
jgi:hypothetical protein